MQKLWNTEIGKTLTILWDFAIQTNRKIKNNKPDIVVKDNERKTCLLTDKFVATEDNISIKEYNKASKYNDLEIEIEKLWHFKTTIVPIIVDMI